MPSLFWRSIATNANKINASQIITLAFVNIFLILLIISLQTSYHNIISKFQDKNIDAGVVCFDSIHPKWSYVRLNEKNKIVETAEKRPISRNAIAGFYYFKKGSYFINASMISIKKDASVNGLFFIAPVINELVLQGMNLEAIKIDEGKYHSFYSPQKIKEYEMLNKKSN